MRPSRLGRALAPLGRRSLHLGPPFLLDEYAPRYQTLSARDEADKRAAAHAHLANCNLCPRRCGVNRFEATGHCLIGEKVNVNVIAPHFGEGQSAVLPMTPRPGLTRGPLQSRASRATTAAALSS